MPRSKRAKVVHLSKLDKKGKELKQKTYQNIQECAGQYQHIFVFSIDNMRNNLLKDVRAELSDCRYAKSSQNLGLANPHRLFFGKTKVMAKALGSSDATEPAGNTHLLSKYLYGAVGLIFTNREPAEILSYFDNYRPLDFARAGTVASRTFTIPAGVIYSRGGEIAVEEDVPLAHTIEPTLRKLGVPTRLVKGRVELESDYEVCKEGATLGSAQTTLLKMFGVATAEFRVDIRAYWTNRDGTGKVVEVQGANGNTNDEMDMHGDGEEEEE